MDGFQLLTWPPCSLSSLLFTGLEFTCTMYVADLFFVFLRHWFTHDQTPSLFSVFILQSSLALNYISIRF